jgi:SAM-dependent methyltransferase
MSFVKRILYRINRIVLNLFNSTDLFWDLRYSEGGNSGYGSYGILAEFKADIINSFIKENKINSVIELGCGDGNQLNLFNCNKYVGIDVSKTIINRNVNSFKNDMSKAFLLYSKKNISKLKRDRFDVSLSLDVIFHLVNDKAYYAYMDNLFSLAKNYVIIYASNNNLLLSPYEKHREFSTYVKNNFPEWELIKFINNKYPFDPQNREETSISDFYFYKRII